MTKTHQIDYKVAMIMMWIILVTTAVSCQKDFLEKRSRTDLVVPSTLDDFQRLLDNDIFTDAPALGEIGSDDYYLSFASWSALNPLERNAYIWAREIYQGTGDVADWNKPYQEIFYANVVLDGLRDLTVAAGNASEWNRLRGSALFKRSFAFYSLTQVFCPPYDSESADSPYGLPLRLSADLNIETERSTVEETYQQIIADLLVARELLPAAVPLVDKNRPSRPAVYALLSRIYLSMRNYELAGLYADSSLISYGSLIDYNEVSQTTNLPFSRSNNEVIYQRNLTTVYDIARRFYLDPTFLVDSLVYDSYEETDLRKRLFSKGNKTVKGSYNGSIARFSGLATDEQYLIRAECRARAGELILAMGDLNALLEKRYIKGTFQPFSAITKEEALKNVLKERRKELLFRGLRWSDLRRLNKEGHDIHLTRKLQGEIYTLSPNDHRWTFPLPDQVITMSGITQNPR